MPSFGTAIFLMYIVVWASSVRCPSYMPPHPSCTHTHTKEKKRNTPYTRLYYKQNTQKHIDKEEIGRRKTRCMLHSSCVCYKHKTEPFRTCCTPDHELREVEFKTMKSESFGGGGTTKARMRNERS